MYQFFRFNNPISLLIFILIGIGLGFYYQGISDTPYIFELRHELVGIKLLEGGTLYKDIIVSMTPLSGLIFQGISYLGIGYKLNFLIGKLIIIIQALLVNHYFKRTGIFPKAGNALAIIYLLLSAISPEFQLPGPELFGLTFLILVWGELMDKLKRNITNNRLFIIGVYIGLAGSFYFAYSYFLLWVLLSILIHSNISSREILLLFIGYLSIVTINYIYLSFNGTVNYFIEFYLVSALEFSIMETAFLKGPALLLIPFLGILILRIFFTNSRSISALQNRILQSNFILMMNAIIIIPLLTTFSLPSVSYLIFPSSIIFLEFFEIRKITFFKHFMASLIILVVFYTQYLNLNNQNFLNEKVKPRLAIKGEKLMVLGDNIEEYYQNSMAGPFIDWSISDYYFDNLHQYTTVIRLKNLINQVDAKYIYDPKDYFGKIKNRLPSIYRKYKKVDDNLYIKI